MKKIWVLETDDGDWLMGLDEQAPYQCVIRAEDALQFIRKKDAEAFLKFFNNIGLDTSDTFVVRYICC